MTDVSFYHLTSTPLERALPLLLEKVIASGHKALVTCETEERMDRLNQWLWTYRPDSFLPHGSTREPKTELQSVLLSTDSAPINQANMLLITDGRVIEEAGPYERILDIFNGNDNEAVEKARSRWTTYKDQLYDLTYLRQTETGGWEKKGETKQ